MGCSDWQLDCFGSKMPATNKFKVWEKYGTIVKQ
jgi:hypothetical protein